MKRQRKGPKPIRRIKHNIKHHQSRLRVQDFTVSFAFRNLLVPQRAAGKLSRILAYSSR